MENAVALHYTSILPAATINIKPPFMKVLSESIRNFFEGFSSFYTTIYDKMKSW